MMKDTDSKLLKASPFSELNFHKQQKSGVETRLSKSWHCLQGFLQSRYDAAPDRTNLLSSSSSDLNRPHSMKISLLTLLLLFSVASAQTLAKEIEYVPSAVEKDEIFSLINESLKVDAWNDEIEKIESFADVDEEDDYRMDVVEITYQPHYHTLSVRHGHQVMCTREVHLDGAWDCWREPYRYIRVANHDEWIYLNSHEEPLINEKDAIELVSTLYSLEKLSWAEYDTEILISDLERVSVGPSYNRKSYSLHSEHAKWGPISVQVKRGPLKDQLVVEEVMIFFTVCDDGEPRYGPNPCEGERESNE